MSIFYVSEHLSGLTEVENAGLFSSSNGQRAGRKVAQRQDKGSPRECQRETRLSWFWSLPHEPQATLWKAPARVRLIRSSPARLLRDLDPSTLQGSPRQGRLGTIPNLRFITYILSSHSSPSLSSKEQALCLVHCAPLSSFNCPGM